jgi:hypothetical protein
MKLVGITSDSCSTCLSFFSTALRIANNIGVSNSDFIILTVSMCGYSLQVVTFTICLLILVL